jgi:hypothetical protein
MKVTSIVRIFMFAAAISWVPLHLRAGEILRVTPATRHLVPKGKSIDAIDGDWIMKNDRVILIIGDAFFGREANMRVQSIQGAVIDFTTLADNRDYLAAFFPQGFPAPDSRRNPAMFAHKIEVVKGQGREVVLRAVRNATDKVPYESVTTYTLRDGESFVRVNTTYTNTSDQKVSFIFGDKLRIDMDIEKEASPLGKTKLAFMYNKWFAAAYAVYSKEGLLITEKPKLASDPATGLLVGFQKGGPSPEVTLKPGQSLEANRFLFYGRDVAEIQRSVRTLEKSRVPLTTIRVTDANDQPLAGVFVDVYNLNEEPVSFAITRDDGTTDIPLAPGDYRYYAFKVGHDSVSSAFSVSKKASKVPVSLAPRTSVKISVKEQGVAGVLPVKVEFKGINGYPDPFLGSPKRAEGANNLYYSIVGEFEVACPPGEYEVTFSRGPEYDVVWKELILRTGEQQNLTAELKRSFTTPGWVIADLHNHSARSGDNDTETRSRIINLAGSGVEFAPATEHNRISSYTDEIKDLGLEAYLASAAGIELTGPTGVNSGPNHQNAFPLTIQPGKQGAGAPPISADVYTQMKGLFDYDSDKTKFVQHNHPGQGISRLYFDGNEDGTLDEGLGTRGFTDAIELQNHVYEILEVTSEQEEVNKRKPVFFWLQMLNQGFRIFGTMTSDNHIVGERGGLRLVYIHTRNDSAPTIDPYEIALSAKNGRMVMSNGPFLKATVNGQLPGEEVKAGGKEITLDIEAHVNNATRLERIQVLINGRQVETLNFTRKSHPQLFNAGGFRHSVPVTLSEDAHIIVVTTGQHESQRPNLTTPRRQSPPFAVTNPIFVDIDGNGFVPNKDTLGASLPVGSPRSNP